MSRNDWEYAHSSLGIKLTLWQGLYYIQKKVEHVIAMAFTSSNLAFLGKPSWNMLYVLDIHHLARLFNKLKYKQVN